MRNLIASLGLACALPLAIAPCAGADGGSSDTKGAEESIPLGPFKLGGGLSGSRPTLTLTGGYSQQIWDLNPTNQAGNPQPCDKGQIDVVEKNRCRVNQLNFTANVDGSWKTGGGSNAGNHLFVTLQPIYEYSPYTIGPYPDRQQIPRECADTTYYSTHIECLNWLHSTGSSTSFAVGVYPELQYRDGSVMQGGKTYDANQLAYGGGVRLMYVDFRGNWFATWPYLSVGYDQVHNYGNTHAPAPTGVQDRYLTAEGQVELYLPWTRQLLRSNSNSIFLARLNTSHPTSGHGWEWSRTFELIVDTGGKLAPAVSYQTGTDKGFSYDRKWLIGVVYSFFGHGGSSADDKATPDLAQPLGFKPASATPAAGGAR